MDRASEKGKVLNQLVPRGRIRTTRDYFQRILTPVIRRPASLLFRDTIKIAGAVTSQVPREKGHPLETALNHINHVVVKLL